MAGERHLRGGRRTSEAQRRRGRITEEGTEKRPSIAVEGIEKRRRRITFEGIVFRAVRREGTTLEPGRQRSNGNTWAFHSPVTEVNASSFRRAAARQTERDARASWDEDFDLHRTFEDPMAETLNSL